MTRRLLAWLAALLLSSIAAGGCATPACQAGYGGRCGLGGSPGAASDARATWMLPSGVALTLAGTIGAGVGAGHVYLASERRAQAGSALAKADHVERDVLVEQAEQAEAVAVWSLAAGVPLLAGGIVLIIVAPGDDDPADEAGADVQVGIGGPAGSAGVHLGIGF